MKIYSTASSPPSQFAVLLKLRHESQHLLRSRDDLILQVKSAVLRRVLQEITIVNHHAAGVGHAPRAGVGVPVDSPHGSAVLQVEVPDGVEGVATPLLPVEVPGAEAHQGRLQDPGQVLGMHPLAGAEQFAEGLGGGGPRRRVCGQFHLLPFLLREEVRVASFLPVLAELALQPGAEPWDRREAGELGHVRKLTLEGRKERAQRSHFNSGK